MRRRFAVLLVVALAVAAGCATPDDAPTSSSGAAVDFTGELVGGGQIDAADHAGEALALWFWSPW